MACNVCGTNNTSSFLFGWDLLLNKEASTANLVKCNQCGLVYQNPRPTLSHIGIHYPPEYDPYIETETTSASLFTKIAKQYGLKKRLRFITRHKTGGTILDIGCASGDLLAALKKSNKHWTLYGVEIDKVSGQSAQEKGVKVFVGTVEDAAYPDNFFDVITMWDVLEHLHNPRATLREVFRILKPTGILVIRVPNLNSIDAKIFGASWAGLDIPRHLYVFSNSTLSRLLKEEGFFIKSTSSSIGVYTTFVLSIRFLLTKRKIKANLQQLILKILYHPLTRFLTFPFFFLIGALGKGPSLVVVAQKQDA
jgi:2-polyprenyl-3-methyl-5-hydroxy-6-metoxy-1,4-benzoquinol methylase